MSRDMARDPSYRERSHSPYSPGRYHYQHRGYHRSPSPPPLPQYPPPPHHDYAQRSRSRSPHWERSPRRDRPSPVRREASPPGRRELSPLARREVSPAGRREPPSPVKRDQEEGGRYYAPKRPYYAQQSAPILCPVFKVTKQGRSHFNCTFYYSGQSKLFIATVVTRLPFKTQDAEALLCAYYAHIMLNFMPALSPRA